MATDTFNTISAAGAGVYSGDYLWSTAANWSGGLPNSSSAVSLNLGSASSGAIAAVDQSFTVASLTWASAGTLLVGGSLTASTLYGAATGRTATNLTVLAGGTLNATTSIQLADTSQASLAGSVTTGTFRFTPVNSYDLASGFSISAGSFTASSLLDLSGVKAATLASGATMNVAQLTLNVGSIDLAGRAAISTLTTQNGGTATIEGVTTIGTVLAGGAITINRGGALELTTGTSGASAFTLNGGSLTLDSLATFGSGTSFTFGSSAGGSNASLLDIANPNYASGTFATTLSKLDLGDGLQFGTAVFTGAAYSNGTITLSGSKSLSITGVSFAADVGTPNFILGKAANGGTIVTVNCFLPGTRIATPAGEAAIESLSAGDLVISLEHGRPVARRLIWAGSRQIDLRGLDVDAARDATPVRIRAHAFADNVPARDLLVTGDHCILELGQLIPARMLVNCTSIVRETDCIEYRIHHVELERHAILLSEGLPTESYAGPAEHPGFAPKADAATPGSPREPGLAAPLRTDRATVEPIWQRLLERAQALGYDGADGPATATDRIALTSTDPALCVQLAHGVTLQPVRRNGGRHFFALPAGTRDALLHSRSAIPAEIEGPFVDDRRRLGVCVRAISLWTDLCCTPIAPGGAGLAGWQAADDAERGRWTNGAGSLVLPESARMTILEIECTGSMRYAADAGTDSRLQA